MIGGKENLMDKKKKVLITLFDLLVLIVMASILFVIFRVPRSHQVEIVIPAGGQDAFYYSDQEISPIGNTIKIYAGEGCGDTMVTLQAVEAKEKVEYQPTYITPGMAVRMDVEKGGWFKIGIARQNPTDEDIRIYVTVEGVDCRTESLQK